MFTHRAVNALKGKEFTWAYENVPGTNFTKELAPAPRFDFDTFAALQRRQSNYWICREDRDAETPEGYLRDRRRTYRGLYDVRALPPGAAWFLRSFLLDAMGNATSPLE